MTTGGETVLADEWIKATLLADGTVTAITTEIHADVAPADTPYPFIIYQLQEPNDVRGVGTTRVITSTLYVVKATAIASDFTSLQPLAEAIDGALHGASGAITGGEVGACVRERPFRLAETTDGNTYRHLGGEYRIQVQGA